jgi:predicted phosphodiesterase
MTVRVLVLSDLHFENAGPDVAPLEPCSDQADLVVLAGDIHTGKRGLEWAAALAQRCGLPVVYVAGNHEYWGHSLKLPGRLTAYAADFRRRGIPVYFLERDSLVVETAGGPARVLGATLWSDFTLFGEGSQSNFMREAAEKMPDYQFIRAGWLPWQHLTPRHTLDICEETIMWMWNVVVHPFADGPTVIVTHTGPSFLSIQESFSSHVLSPVFASDFEEVIRFGDVALWVHGHVHHSVDYMVGRTRVVCNPRGYWPDRLNPAFDPGLVIGVG